MEYELQEGLKEEKKQEVWSPPSDEGEGEY